MLTPKPFGVNLIVEETTLGPASTFEHVEVCIEAGISRVVFFWNSPPATWFTALHDAGIKIWLTVSSVAEARHALASGYDAIVVQANEAGGHVRATKSGWSSGPRCGTWWVT